MFINIIKRSKFDKQIRSRLFTNAFDARDIVRRVPAQSFVIQHLFGRKSVAIFDGGAVIKFCFREAFFWRINFYIVIHKLKGVQIAG